jgi:hypothetical protein
MDWKGMWHDILGDIKSEFAQSKFMARPSN